MALRICFGEAHLGEQRVRKGSFLGMKWMKIIPVSCMRMIKSEIQTIDFTKLVGLLMENCSVEPIAGHKNGCPGLHKLKIKFQKTA